MTTTTNYSFVKRKIGHPVRDDDIGDNLVLIDTAIKVRETEIDALQKGLITAGNIDITATTVWKIEFPFKVTINKVNTVVSIGLSAHQTTVTLKNNAGTSMTNVVVTIASAAAKGYVDTASPTLNNVIDAGEDLQLVSSGSCTTGNVIAIVHYTRTA